jgi:excisionase family DNA binding protein
VSPKKKSTPTIPSVAPTQRLFTIKQAAEYLGASIWHIRELYWADKLTGKRVGKRINFDIADLNKYADSLPKA